MASISKEYIEDLGEILISFDQEMRVANVIFRKNQSLDGFLVNDDNNLSYMKISATTFNALFSKLDNYDDVTYDKPYKIADIDTRVKDNKKDELKELYKDGKKLLNIKESQVYNLKELLGTYENQEDKQTLIELFSRVDFSIEKNKKILKFLNDGSKNLRSKDNALRIASEFSKRRENKANLQIVGRNSNLRMSQENDDKNQISFHATRHTEAWKPWKPQSYISTTEAKLTVDENTGLYSISGDSNTLMAITLESVAKHHGSVEIVEGSKKDILRMLKHLTDTDAKGITVSYNNTHIRMEDLNEINKQREKNGADIINVPDDPDSINLNPDKVENYNIYLEDSAMDPEQGKVLNEMN
jgi:hypothetical protein